MVMGLLIVTISIATQHPIVNQIIVLSHKIIDRFYKLDYYLNNLDTLNNCKLMKYSYSTSIVYFCIILIGFSSCKKDEETPNNNESDFSKYRVSKEVLHSVSSSQDYSRTINYDYSNNGDDIVREVTYSNSSSVYVTSYTKSGSRIDLETRRDGALTEDGYYELLSSGNVDTTYFWDHSANRLRSASKYEYNGSNEQVRNINKYSSYTSDIKKYYSNGNTTHWIYDRIDHTDPNDNRTDSIVFEQYMGMPLVVTYGFDLGNRYGERDEHLVKKRTFYELTNNNQVRQTIDYEYVLDEKGLVTKQILMYTEEPSGMVTQRDTISYTYIILD